jgi:hypothetical protein
MTGKNKTKRDLPRCPKGTRRNPKTLECEKMPEKTILMDVTKLAPVSLPEPVVAPEPVITTEPEVELKKPADIKPVILKLADLPNTLHTDMSDVIEPRVDKKGKTKRCPPGYRMKKDGKCHRQTKKASIKPVLTEPPLTEKTEEIVPIAEMTTEESPAELSIEEILSTKPLPIKPIEPEILTSVKEEVAPIYLKGKSQSYNNALLLQRDKEEYDEFITNPESAAEYDHLYPSLNDPDFNIKIAQRREFFNTQYDGTLHDIKSHADILCNADFELMPHQLFVKNLLSFQTPYNSLLLYHGLGSGKTCSAISIAEEMRSYMIQVGINQRILVIASPNVQANFRLQLFDESKLQRIPNPNQTNGILGSDDEIWNLNTCIGNTLLREINPTSLTGLSREKIVSQINAIINRNYAFMGYGQLVNYISSKIESDGNTNVRIRKIKQFFNNRLIIIDEVHNIRPTEDNKNKKGAVLLMELAKYSENMRLLFLSATPMFNSYKEIIWLTNLMNANDKRGIIETSDVFDKEGNFTVAKDGNESGDALLRRKMTGYVSYVRGENPYTFPYRIFPSIFSAENALLLQKYPTIQMNGRTIDDPIKYLQLFINNTGVYQNNGYSFIIENMRKRSYSYFTKHGDMREMPSFENMEAFGYTILQPPLEALNIVYPNTRLDTKIKEILDRAGIEEELDETTIEADVDIISNSISTNGLLSVIQRTMPSKTKTMYSNYDYKPDIIAKYGRIFHQDHIHKYSAKIANICNIIRETTGIVLIYSQYIDGGIIPLALALEEMGFSRYCSTESYNKPLFKTRRTEQVDAITMKSRSEAIASGDNFSPAKYIMITGDKGYSPSNAQDIKYATSPNNLNGEMARVILVSKAGSEGLDFKNIRQVHILEPWYNMNRIEQIIGRGVRNLSHCMLPFENRAVEIYMHATRIMGEEEAADLYVYRVAEKKALQIGKVTRLLKEISVDCILNIGQTQLTAEKLMTIAQNQNIQLKLSSGKMIDFKIGDQPFTDACDYLDNCEYKCSPSANINPEQLIQTTYKIEYLRTNKNTIINKIKALFREHTFYKKNVLINSINIVKQYPIDQIYYALTYLIQNKNEQLTDKYGRTGYLINRGEYYYFQPTELSDETASIYDKSAPIDYKRSHILLENPKEIREPTAQLTNADVAPAPKRVVIKPAKKRKQASVEPVLPAEKEPVAEEDADEEHSMSSIVNAMVTKYNIIFSKTKIAIGPGEKNWYKHANHVVDELLITFGIPREQLQQYVIEHMIDMLLLPDKLLLVKELYSEYPSSQTQDGEQYNTIVKVMRTYFDKRLLEESNNTAILLTKNNAWKIFVKPDEYSENADGEWNEGEPEDYRLFGKELDRFSIDDDKINNIVGFINMFKDKDMVFKIKDVRQARNNIGARCGDSTTKGDVIKLLNALLDIQMYDNKTDKNHYGLCVIIEVLMRHFNNIKRNDKVYFLTAEETAINDIVKYSRV